MSSVVIAGDTSGTVTISAPAVAGTTTLTLPATTGTFITTTGGVTPSTAGNLLTSNGTAWTSTAPAASGPYVTDATDITLVNIASSQVNVGTSFSVSIPTTGYINLTSFAGRLTWSSVADLIGVAFGIRISSTNYWFGKISNNGTLAYSGLIGTSSSAGFDEWYGALIKYASPGINAIDAAPLSLDIIANSVPTGTQTVQLIAAYGAANRTGIGILKGTTTTTRVAIEFVTAS